MKKIILTCLLLSASLTWMVETSAQTFPQPYRNSTAEIADRYPHNIKLNFLSPFVLTANVAYEQFINAKTSVQIGFYYNGITLRERDLFWLSLPSARYRSFAVTPEVRFYTGDATRPKLNGFYIAPFVRYQNIDITITADLQENNDRNDNRTFEGNLNSFRLGGVAGYKFILAERLSLEAFAGPSLRVVKWLNSNTETYSAEDFLPFGLSLRAGATIGFVF